MKISKDLMDALMMLSFIILVLVATSDFENTAMKNILMIGSGVVVAISVTGRVLAAKKILKRNNLYQKNFYPDIRLLLPE
ncbi:MAG: hypothetical protein LUE98_18505 [Tannerellaceae bacterium]|nr:hypothetical protein [Tannerellaceae bacterium]